jgi:UDPglucose 6-dehydrogenase
MIGTGYVGLVSGTCFADLGNKVYCVDKDESKINKLQNAISPIYEPGLDDLIRNNARAKRLYFTDDLEKAVKESKIIFICVGTPNKKN